MLNSWILWSSNNVTATALIIIAKIKSNHFNFKTNSFESSIRPSMLSYVNWYIVDSFSLKTIIKEITKNIWTRKVNKWKKCTRILCCLSINELLFQQHHAECMDHSERWLQHVLCLMPTRALSYALMHWQSLIANEKVLNERISMIKNRKKISRNFLRLNFMNWFLISSF